MANYIRSLSAFAGAFLICLAFIGTMSPASAATFNYNLFDHRKGGDSSFADYGIRLEAHPDDQYFSFDPDNGASAQLRIETLGLGAGTAKIEGDVYENNSADGSFGLWTLEYTLTGVTITDETTGEFTATGGTGSLTRTGQSIDLTGKQNNDGEAFQFFYGDFRGWTGFTGWGWVVGMPTPNDFLFEAVLDDPGMNVVPVPAALPLLLTGLGLMGWFSRRRKRAVGAA